MVVFAALSEAARNPIFIVEHAQCWVSLIYKYFFYIPLLPQGQPVRQLTCFHFFYEPVCWKLPGLLAKCKEFGLFFSFLSMVKKTKE